jgi:hypothetical protein
MDKTPTKILVIGTYFGQWPVWFPAFLLSCARNETIEWLFFTDCGMPDASYSNIRFEPMTLGQLNSLASQKLGFLVNKAAYSQVDLQPTFGVLFQEYIEGFEFWGHCDFDVIWGDVRRFIIEEVLQNYDIVSCRREFLAGHLTLWRNKDNINRLFESVPSYREVLTLSEHCNFDEAVISTSIKDLIAKGQKIRVFWPKDMVFWFRGNSSPTGWLWENGRVYDVNQREHIYLHFQAAKKFVRSIDFEVGDQPRKFRFTHKGIRAHQSSIRDILREKFNQEQLKELSGTLIDVFLDALRLLKKHLLVKNFYWSRRLAENSISGQDVRYIPETGQLLLKRIGLRIDKQQQFMLAGYHSALLLANRSNGSFYRDEQGQLFVEIGNFCALLRNVEDLHVLQELFINGVYNLQFSRPTVVLDVGMHVGLTTLLFASQSQVIVVGCEPCEITFDRALDNIALNPAISDRIRTIKVGIGPLSYRTIAGYLPKEGSQEDTGTDQNRHGMGPAFEYEEVEVKDIAETIDCMAADYPDRDLALKIDLKRSEYYIDGITECLIFNRLQATGKINMINTIMLKWHRRKRNDLPVIVKQLQEAGFSVLLLEPNNEYKGMLYAIRTNLAEFH